MARAPHDHHNEPLECVRTFWVMVGSSKLPITCALYRMVAGGLELRVGYGERDALLRQPVVAPLAAETLASVWKFAAEAKGFRDLSSSSH
jgi:hypothetical protein